MEPTAELERRVHDLLAEVTDPELPVPITELGITREISIRPRQPDSGCRLNVTLVPTFLGCPAQLFIERDVRAVLAAVPGLDDLQIHWLPAANWSPANITAEGRRRLAELGVAVPDPVGNAQCPNCRSDRVRIDSDFGSSLCRRLGHCEVCGDPIEIMRSRPLTLQKK